MQRSKTMAENTMKSDTKSMLGIMRLSLSQQITDYTSYLLSARSFISIMRANLKYKVEEYEEKQADITKLDSYLSRIGDIFSGHKKGYLGKDDWKSEVEEINEMLTEVDEIVAKNDMVTYQSKTDGTL